MSENVTTPEAKKPDTLFSLLDALEQADEGLLQLKPEEHREALLKAELKIDAYKYVLMRYDSRITEIKNEIEELTAVKRTLEKRQESLKSLLLYILKEKGLEQFPGVKYVVKLMNRKKVSVIEREPNSMDFSEHPDLVKRTYSWDKRAVADAYRKNPELYKHYAVEDVSEFVQFNLRKGLDE